MAEKLAPTGAIGIAPPPDAPLETSHGLTADERMVPAHARGNERELAPLTYGTGASGAPAGSGAVQEATHEVQAPKAVQAAPGYKVVPPREQFPAASNSDSPSRGVPGTTPIPRERTTPPLAVTGGFGVADAEYFPLDGRELKTLIEELMDKLHARLQNDLRFSVALTYPRVACRVQIVVECETEDSGMIIEQVLPPNGKWDRTPREVAIAHGDSVVFALVEQRQEVNAAGEDEQPADAIRQELQIEGPRKRSQGFGVNRTFSDVNW
jgi:hypothetical protein